MIVPGFHEQGYGNAFFSAQHADNAIEAHAYDIRQRFVFPFGVDGDDTVADGKFSRAFHRRARHDFTNRAKEEIFRKIISEEGIEPLPGVRRLLEDLKLRKIPCAVASSSCRKNIDLALEITDLRTYFSGIISEECALSRKPMPDVFLQASVKLERNPSEIVIFEDSLAGIEAGIAGGFKVVAVATTNPADLLRRTRAHCVVDSLTKVSVGLIDVLLRER